MAEEESMLQAMAAAEDELDEFYGGIYHYPNSRNLSRLSVCTSSFTTNESYDLYEEHDAREGGGERDGSYTSLCGGVDDQGVTDAMGSCFSMLSIENFDADVEFSEEGGEEEGEEEEEGGVEGSSSFSSCSILGASPREAWRARQGMASSKKEYTSDNEAREDKENRTKKKKKKTKKVGLGGESGSGRWGGQNRNDGGGGESECGGGGGGCGSGSSLMVMTRAKGGNSRLWMDMEEVKACRELGLELELERERTIEIPERISLSGSFDTGSSGGNSPIANWRISSPGDDPRDVKARLKVWAQMVALASSSLHTH